LHWIALYIQQMQNKLMENTESVPLLSIEVGQQTFAATDLKAVCGAAQEHLPVVLRLLAENVARNMEGAEMAAAIAALQAWPETGTSESEIAFKPGRVLMHDTTSTPALVDLAAMRSTLAEAGVDPSVLNASLPVDVSVDHSLAVEAFARHDAPGINMAFEIRRNAERYSFLRWASKVLRGVRIHPPGTGIMHTINLEQLATVVSIEERNGVRWLVPDMMIGTDSHTPMVNGIGVLGWGVGGLEAQTVMFGMPTMLRIPDVIGVKLTGALRPGVLATDLALAVTQRLRAIGVSGEFVEFYGSGVSALTAGDRNVVANMAPEYGRPPASSRSMNAHSTISGRPDAPGRRLRGSSPTTVRQACGSTPWPNRSTREAFTSISMRSTCTSPVRGGRRICSDSVKRPRPSGRWTSSPSWSMRACRATRSPSPPSRAARTRRIPVS
jgi:hypothetical protein